jgi:D-lactate dehydrogenase (cytochrome)
VRDQAATSDTVAPEIDRTSDVLSGYLDDAAHYAGGHADGVARPRTEAEVSGVVRSATRVLPVGAQSSVTGGATPDGGLVLSTERLLTIHEPGHSRIRVGAGVPLETLQKLLQTHGQWYAPVPTFTGAFVGGVVATNAAGAATFKYGATRGWVEGLTVVMACGHVLDIERGAIRAHPREGFVITCDCGTRQVMPGTYRMPDVPKVSAGYFAAPGMDLIDLFIGSEGTLGIVTDVSLRIAQMPASVVLAAVFARGETAAIRLVETLRRASQETWRADDTNGIDVAAIESLDARCLEMLEADGATGRCGVTIPSQTGMLLLIQVELPAGSTPERVFSDAADALDPEAADSPMTRLTRLLDSHHLLDRTEIVVPGDAHRVGEWLAFRESAPAGVNRRVGDMKRDVDGRIDKTAADMIVPFEHFEEMLAIYRAGFERRGLDYAIWGHISDGNVHPNLIPTSFEDVVAAREAILEFGLEATRLGGSPLAEHGVGRSRIKQALLRQMYGDAGIEEMRKIKRALDPQGKFSPGVVIGSPDR